MPYAAPILDDDEKQQQEGQGVNISGVSTQFDNLPGQDAPQGRAGKQSSGQYANLQSYLDANKDQGDAMGGKIADDVGGQAQDASDKIQDYGSQQYQTEAYDPTAALNNAPNLTSDEKAQYKKVKKTGGYEGPGSVDQAQGYQAANESAAKASRAVSQAGNEYGQQELLKQSYARPKYSAGENKLDQVLLQNSAGSKSRLEDISQRYSGLQAALDSANQKIGSDINAANAQALENRQKFIPAEQSAVSGLLDPITARANQQNIDNAAKISRVENDLSDLKLNEETLAALGLSGGERLFGLDLSNYLTRDQSQVGVDNAASAEERAKYLAMKDLIEDQSMNQITAGGKAINAIGLDRGAFDTDLSAATSAFNNLASTTNRQGDYRLDWLTNPGPTLGIFDYHANQNVGNYLENGLNPNMTVTSPSYSNPNANRPDMLQYTQYADAAKQNLYQNILSWLDQQNYNRVVGKE